MNKFKNDSFYKNKFCCFKAEYAEKCLTEAELSILNVLLQKIENNYPNREYLCINQDEPYADKVWELIKESEKENTYEWNGSIDEDFDEPEYELE